MTELIQCEECGDVHPEKYMELKEAPGATLAFCETCVRPSRAEMYGVIR